MDTPDTRDFLVAFSIPWNLGFTERRGLKCAVISTCKPMLLTLYNPDHNFLPFDLRVARCREHKIGYTATDCGVDSSSRFLFRTRTDRHKLTDATDHPIHALTTGGSMYCLHHRQKNLSVFVHQ